MLDLSFTNNVHCRELHVQSSPMKDVYLHVSWADKKTGVICKRHNEHV